MTTISATGILVICAQIVAVHLASAAVQLFLGVEYPEEGRGNYSVVKLTCRDVLFLEENAEFLKDGVVLTSGPASHQVTITNTGNGEISFIFTQQQEGNFSCRRGGDVSEEIGLAGIIIKCS